MGKRRAKQNKELEKSYCRGIIGVSGVTGRSALAVEIAVLFPELTSIIRCAVVNLTVGDGLEKCAIQAMHMWR